MVEEKERFSLGACRGGKLPRNKALTTKGEPRCQERIGRGRVACPPVGRQAQAESAGIGILRLLQSMAALHLAMVPGCTKGGKGARIMVLEEAGGLPPAEELAEGGIELIAPHRKNRRHMTQDRRPLRGYKRRRTAGRTISWIRRYRPLCIRREKLTTLFQGFLHLGWPLLLLKEVLG